MNLTDPEFDDWVQRARQVDILATAERLGATLKRSGSGEHVGACPACNGTDRFQVKPKDGVFLCRGSACGKNGSDGGDVITMAMHILACDFVAACENVTGEPPPKSQGSERRTYDEDAQRARRDAHKDQRIIREAEEESEFEKNCRDSEKLFAAGQPIPSTHAWRYLTLRGLRPAFDRIADLRFIPALTYYGFEHPNQDEPVDIGAYPCMLAAIRNQHGRIIGVHRTYLDPDQPRKVRFDFEQDRNKAKKVYGNGQGGLIWLGPPCASIAIAEGIETALSWEALAPTDADFTVCAAYSLSNLSGRCTGSVKHPAVPSASVINGIPDLSEPGIILPADVSSVTVLGDGDPPPQDVRTRQSVLAGARRFRAQGKTVSIAMAPSGKDWNDVLLEQLREGQAA